MRFMMMTTNEPNEPLTPPTPEMYAEMGKLIEMEKGVRFKEFIRKQEHL